MIGKNELLRAKLMGIEFKWSLKASKVIVRRLTAVSMELIVCSKLDK
jgi:hypothetical protein